MPVLDTLLAYSVTMLVLATIVTQIVRAFQRLMSKRQSAFTAMLNEFFSREVQPVVKRELARLKNTSTAAAGARLSQAADSLNLGTVFPGAELKGAVTLSTEELIEQLKRSEAGKSFLEELGNEAHTLFTELGRRYEIVGDKFTVSFRKNSRNWATGIALLLAVILNIDSVHILRTYFSDVQEHDAALARVDGILGVYQKDLKTIQPEQQGPAILAELDTAIRQTRASIDTLSSYNFPIGWSNFPFTTTKATAVDPRRDANLILRWLLWIAGIMVTGIMAGLGATFWYDTVLGIRKVAAVAKAK